MQWIFMNNEKLVEVCLTDKRWVNDVYGIVNEGWDLVGIAEEEAERLRLQVLYGGITIDELRAGVAWVNALDKESVELYGADVMQGDQRAERIARRLMHLSARSAYKDLKTNRKRQIARVACKHTQNLVQ